MFANSLIIVTIILTKTSGNCQDNTGPIFHFSSWDFETILKTTTFIDRTLLLRTLFEERHKVLIIAPRLSGKSTNLNMVKRFLEITVDENGLRRKKSKTSNYKLFEENYLNIFNDHYHFFHHYFGRYPVIFIDYKFLCDVQNFDSLTNQYGEVLMNTFEQHEYLVNSLELWSNGNNKELFLRYCQIGDGFSLTALEIIEGIPFLSKLLYEQFNEKVYIIMDEYDAFVEGPMLSESLDKNKIITFIYNVNHRMFEGNKYIFRALVTGVTRHNNSRLFLQSREILPNSIVEYDYRNYNPFCQYYGVAPDELDRLLSLFIKSPREKEKVKTVITLKSTTLERKNQLYNTWSTIRYLANFNETYLQN